MTYLVAAAFYFALAAWRPFIIALDFINTEVSANDGWFFFPDPRHHLNQSSPVAILLSKTTCCLLLYFGFMHGCSYRYVLHIHG
jgi:hypothetical protein